MSITPLLRALPRYRERCYHDFNPAVMANIMEPVAVMNGSMRLISFSDVEGIERNSAVSDNTFALFSSYALSRLPPVICANLSGCLLMATLTIKRRGLQVRWGSGVCRKGEREGARQFFVTCWSMLMVVLLINRSRHILIACHCN